MPCPYMTVPRTSAIHLQRLATTLIKEQHHPLHVTPDLNNHQPSTLHSWPQAPRHVSQRTLQYSAVNVALVSVVRSGVVILLDMCDINTKATKLVSMSVKNAPNPLIGKMPDSNMRGSIILNYTPIRKPDEDMRTTLPASNHMRINSKTTILLCPPRFPPSLYHQEFHTWLILPSPACLKNWARSSIRRYVMPSFFVGNKWHSLYRIQGQSLIARAESNH
jgi:hypothetical protein